MSSFEKKINPFLEFKDKLDVAEAKKLGLKDEEVEVEKFIQVRPNSKSSFKERFFSVFCMNLFCSLASA